MGVNITQGDAVAWARNYDGPLFHAMLCDPPYHLTSIVKRFGGSNAAPAQFGKDGAFARASKGFMGKQWDGGDVAFDPATWDAFASVLYPGAFGMAFASSRGWHRLAVAIEDAGLIIHPTIFGYSYGSGFPKATRVKAPGFDGYRYGLQALKPALEPIIVFQKPYEGRPIDNITQYGAGVLNIDGARIGYDETGYTKGGCKDKNKRVGYGYKEAFPTEQHPNGRWPSNFILLDDGAAEALDRQSGHLESGQPMGVKKAHNNIYGEYGTGIEITGYGDAGGASRFFFQVQEAIDSSDPVYYCAKASTEERNAGLDDMPLHMNPHSPNATGGAGLRTSNNRSGDDVHNPHPTVKPMALARYLATLLLPPTEYAPRRLFIPFFGVGSEGIGSMQAGWEEIEGIELTPEYIPIAQARVEYWRNRGWQLSMFSETLTMQDAQYD